MTLRTRIADLERDDSFDFRGALMELRRTGMLPTANNAAAAAMRFCARSMVATDERLSDAERDMLLGFIDGAAAGNADAISELKAYLLDRERRLREEGGKWIS